MNLNRDRSAWLQGAEAVCQVQPIHPPKSRRIVLLGAPGVGKGTQAALLSAAFGACHLSTGDLFRAACTHDPAELSATMRAAIGRMQRGELVPDETVLRLILDRASCLTCRGGFILDGFPRTVPQAAALDVLLHRANLSIDAVLSYDLSVAAIIARVSGRRICPVCKTVYHISSLAPRLAGLCDGCGSTLMQREDDQPDAVRVRQGAYDQSTAPLLNYYANLHLLVRIEARGTPEEIFARTTAALRRFETTGDRC